MGFRKYIAYLKWFITGRVTWRFCVALFDDVDRTKVEIALKEAVSFMETYSKFDVEIIWYVNNQPHLLTKEGNSYWMAVWDISDKVIWDLPVADSYLFFYNTGEGKLPSRAGNAMGVEYGVIKEGVGRPWSTMPVDYVNFTNDVGYEGFKSWAAQIVAHEANNCVSNKISVLPYECATTMNGGGSGEPSYKYEANRLLSIRDECYRKIAKLMG